VSPGCDLVLVNGREMRGRWSLVVTFSSLQLSTQLEMRVWVPRLPLQIHVSDTELSQVKGWRVPIAPTRRPTRDSEDDDDEERRGRGCALQYQYALVRVLTSFVAEPSDPALDLLHMLGPDWQADITHLVQDFLKVEEPRVARLLEGRVLVGREEGITTVQVLSPLSDSILAEKTVTVLDDKVSISDLGVQLVSSLSVSLQPSPGSSQALALTASAHQLLHAHKQEAVISAWIQYSDGAVTPLNIYDPKDFTLNAFSLDEAVVSTYQESPQRWPVVVAEGEGQGVLVRVEMVISESCQKSKRKSVLASGLGSVRVEFRRDDSDLGEGGRGGGRGGRGSTAPATRGREEGGRRGGEGGKYHDPASEREEGAMRKVSTTTKSPVTQRGKGSQGGRGAPRQPGEHSSLPAQVEVPGAGQSDLSQTPRGLSDLEIGMYALLGVFCLAILVFLINCVSFAFRYRHKQLPVLEQGNLNHAHDWVWLGQDAELLSPPGQASRPDERSAGDRGDGGYEESKFLLNGSGGAGQGGQRGVAHGQTLPRSLSEPRRCGGKDPADILNSPGATAKRKRVKFTSFATVLPNDGGGPYTNSILVGREDDIKWVCQDMDLGQSDIRTYMERLQDNL
ncbi:transmembrane protein 132C-like, partial [Osmerus eperlanus]|uniref:transmembrane protein 132C-like n=1 Tax=Osmerus eperlanus TaxID=29151 RepID=UPI002E1186EA